MATGQSPISRFLCRIATASPAHDRSDGQLLRSFVTRHDEAGFAELVRRHGPLVLAVCRRVLGDDDDAEDAFQAVFLVLARKAGLVTRPDSLAGWLHGVAYRIASKAKVAAARRRRHEKEAAALATARTRDEPPGHDLAAAIHDELQHLPAKYRDPLVLCALGGKSTDEAAGALGWPRGTVATRIARGRALLRRRLARRGITLSAGLVAGALAQATAAAVPPALLRSVVRNAGHGLGGLAPAASPKALALFQGEIRAMFLTRLKTVLLFLALAALTGVGAGLLAVQAGAAGKAQTGGAAGADPNPSAAKPRPGPDRVAAPDEDGFIRDWLVLAPLPWGRARTAGQALDREQVPDEAALWPRAADRLKAGGRAVSWRRYRATGPVVDLKAVLGRPTRHSVGYAVGYLAAAEEMKDVLLVVSHLPSAVKAPEDDLTRVYLNGARVTGAEVTLQKGVNVIVWKMVSDNQAWSGCLRLARKRPDGLAEPLTSLKVLRYTPSQKAASRSGPAAAPKGSAVAAGLAQSRENLKRIGAAMHRYYDAHGHFPTAAIYGKDGKPLLSWRVALLPYLGQGALYKKFNLQEPWDGPHNRKLLSQMPKVYASPGARPKQPDATFYQVCVGKGTLFEGTVPAKLTDIRGATASTILAVEAGDPVPWTKPADVTFAAGKALPRLGGVFKDGLHLLAVDGSVHYTRKDIDPKKLRAAVARAPQDAPVDLNDLRR